METNTSTEQDPFAAPCGDVAPPEFPLLKPDQLYNVLVAKSEVRQKEDGGQTLAIVVKTTTDAFDTKGRSLNVGFPLYYYLGLTPSERRDQKKVTAELAQVMRELGVDPKMTLRDFLNNPKVIEGQVVVAKVTVAKATDTFPESNKVTFVAKKA